MRLARSFALLAIVSTALPVVHAHAAAPPEAPVVREAKDLSQEQFAALPDAAVVNGRSGRTTAGAMRAKQKANALAVRGRLESAKKLNATQADAAALRFNNTEKLRLDTTNARQRATFANLPMQTGTPSYSGPPEIQTAPSSLEPGAFLLLEGRGFGAQVGKVIMKGLPTGDRELVVEQWKNTALGITVPGIVGVQDQNVRLQVVRKDGKSSAERVVSFTATRESFHLLPAKLVNCAENATDNNCDASAGFFAVHTEDTFWETDANGCDEWKIPTLLNGWKISDFTVTEMSNGGGRVGGMGKPGIGKTSATWNACWYVPGTGGFSGNGAGYTGFFVITGPKGVPYK